MPVADSGARPLRILQVIEAAFAGTGRHCLDLVGALLARGHEVHIVYSPTRMEQRFARELESLSRARAVTLPMRPGLCPGDLAAIRAVRRYLRQYGPFDVVHGHSSKAGAIARIAASGLGIRRVVYTAHAFRTLDPTLRCSLRSFYAFTEAFLGRFFSDVVIASSSEELAHGLSIGIPQRRLRMIHNVARVPADLPDRATARRLFGVADHEVALAFVGRLSPQKAPERFIDLVAALRPDIPRLRAFMLGYGPLETEVRERIDAAGLGEVLTIYRDRRGWDAMAAADLFVLTSRYEGMPYALLEAGALGIPVLTLAVGGVSDLTALGLRARVVPNTAGVDVLAQAARELLAEVMNEPKEVHCIPNPEVMIDEILGIYRNVDNHSRWRMWDKAHALPLASAQVEHRDRMQG